MSLLRDDPPVRNDFDARAMTQPLRVCSHVIEPLTARDVHGCLYLRCSAVEDQIREALSLPRPALLAWIGGARSPGGKALREEALVYLLRQSRRAGDNFLTEALAKALLGRCAVYIQNKMVSLGSDQEDGYRQVVTDLFERIFLEQAKDDYMQVRFWGYLKCLVVTRYRRCREERDRSRRNTSLDARSGTEAEPEDGAGTPEEDFIDRETLEVFREGLLRLPDALQEVVILLLEEYPIESKDPSVLTVSTMVRVTPRTIRNWLKEIRKILGPYRT